MLTKDFLRARHRDELSSDDIAALESAITQVQSVKARQGVVSAGQRIRQSTLLLEGFMCRYMDDRKGERQLVALHVPGDFVDLHGFPMRRLDHDIATLTDAKVAIVPHAALTAIVATRPNLTKLLWFSTLLDAAMHREWIFRLGRLNALQRVAHLFCETEARLRAIGRSDGRRFELPITQLDIGEACGLTSVHVNRTLRQLRETGLLTFKNGEALVGDLARLAKISEFDPSYLYLEHETD